ncbi:MAG: sensor histidine kinase [Dissulfurispiraceae bacterium]
MLEFIRSTYFQGLLDSFSAGVVIFNSEGLVYAVNKSSYSILDLDTGDHIRKHWLELFAGFEQKKQLEEMVLYVTKNMRQAPYHFTNRFSDKEGTFRHLSLSASPLIYHEKLFGIVIEINDITNIVLLHEREKSILQERNILQQERYEGLRKMSMSVSHQIRNPVMVIGGLAKRIPKEIELSKGQKGYFDTIRSCVNRMEDIVTAVYEYSSLNTGERHLTDLGLIIDMAREEALLRFSVLPVEVIWQVEIAPYELPVDRYGLSKGIAEIFANSLESFVASPGVIKVSGSVHEGFYRLEITDTGRGIPEANLNYIFDPFFTTKTVGVGMGLCKAEKVIKDHGGRITVRNADSGGTQTSIEFTLPL